MVLLEVYQITVVSGQTLLIKTQELAMELLLYLSQIDRIVEALANHHCLVADKLIINNLHFINI